MTAARSIETAERIVNLAMYLSAARAPVTWENIRSEVAGYPPEQSRDAFLRMFERDKKQLRESGTRDRLRCRGHATCSTSRPRSPPRSR